MIFRKIRRAEAHASDRVGQKYVDPEYGRQMDLARAEGEALLARMRHEASIRGPVVVMRQCIACGTDIGPMDQTRGQWACSQKCKDAKDHEMALAERAESWRSWMIHRYGYGTEWCGVVD